MDDTKQKNPQGSTPEQGQASTGQDMGQQGSDQGMTQQPTGEKGGQAQGTSDSANPEGAAEEWDSGEDFNAGQQTDMNKSETTV